MELREYNQVVKVWKCRSIWTGFRLPALWKHKDKFINEKCQALTSFLRVGTLLISTLNAWSDISKFLFWEMNTGLPYLLLSDYSLQPATAALLYSASHFPNGQKDRGSSYFRKLSSYCGKSLWSFVKLSCLSHLFFFNPPHSLLNLIFELVTEIKLVFLHAVLFIRWHSLPLEDTLKKRGAHQGEQEAYQHHLSYQQLALSLLHIPFKYSQSTIVYRVDTLKHFWTIISVVLDVESVCWGKNLS